MSSPGTVVGRFVARRTLRSATVWGYIFGAYTASKVVGFAKAYPTAQARVQLSHSFANNVGLEALLGQPHRIETIAGYAAWNTLSVLTIVGSIWAFLLATKYFRGEEVAGRTEMLLAGQTSPRLAALNTLAGLATSLGVLYLITAICFVVVGRLPSIGFSASNSVFFALASTASAAVFMAIGALMSQLFATRSRASSACAIIFGVCFLLRAAGDITNWHWLLVVTPLGWIEKLQPMVGSHAVWLVPIALTIAVCCGLTVWIAGRRDLGESIIADKDEAQPRTRLLNSPLGATFRLTRAILAGWLTSIIFLGAFYGFLTKAAVQAFKATGSAQKVFGKIEHAGPPNFGVLYLGVVFLILIMVVMAYAASAVSHVRSDEANGYLDNFLVRPISRQRWLASRLVLVVVVAVIASLSSSLVVWLSSRHQVGGISLHDFWIAGLNMLPSVLFTLGVGVLVFGFWPRLTALAAYGVLGWSFLISMVSSGVNLSHWVLDTSILNQISLAPAKQPDWHTNFVILALAAACIIIGTWAFDRRDLQYE